MNFRSRKTITCSTIMKVSVVQAVLALLLVGSCSADSLAARSFDVTRHFSLSANSTCGGDPPTLFEDQNAPGVLLNCTSGEYEARLALDGDSNTRWQSATGHTPVTLTFSLQQASLAIELAAIHLQVSAALPELLLLEVQTRDGGGFTLVQVYTADPVSSCPEYTAQGIPCSAYENLTTVIVCPVNFSGPVSQFRFTTSGFSSRLSALMQYMTLNEATILGRVVDGFFVRSLHHISVEGEEGRNMDTREVVQTATDEAQFPGFSFRGYSVLQFSSSQREMVQWMFPSLPAASRYQLVFRYGNSGTSRTLGGCSPPCYATLTNASNVNQAAEFELSTGPLTVTMTLSSVNFVLDSIIAIPEHFYAPMTLADGGRFTQNCGVSSGSLGPRPAFYPSLPVLRGTVDEAFCLESAVQLSAEFYSATYACDCPNGSMCEEYGGQCPCMAAADGFINITGRQCNLCPFLNYLTPQGCAACGCSNPLEDCDVTTGQCSCRPLVTGRTCDRCEVNSYGDPDLGCMPCACNSTGTVGTCNQTSGECTCKPSVMGPLCNQCVEGTYNFSSAGCALCECDTVGSVSANCSDEGQCQCKPGVTGLKCSECLPGFYFLSDTGCLPCNCSSRSSICQQDPISLPTIPSEQCSCPQPYMGGSCEGCIPGFFLSSATGDCESCQCNARALTCTPDNGTCIGCTNNTRGERCEVCQEGYYDADPSTSLLCQPCPCNNVTALNTSCTPDISGSPICYCRPGHEGPLCDSCSPGFFGQPPNFRCTQCDCNGNIDPSIPGSCDTSTGVCLLCVNNTIGDECERCAPGFFGDATAQNCTSCACLPDGSDSSLCDSSTGQCSCLPGVNGQRCEQCMPGFWNFTAGVGCEPCVCGVHSANNECNMETGACTCIVGVGGSDCSFCLPGFFNFSNGCTACGCGIGAVSDNCSEEGECYCQPGAVGPKCDTCDTFHMALTSAGCEPCGECEQMLRTRLQTAQSTLNVTIQDTDTFGMLLDADMRGFARVSMGMTEVQSNISATRSYLNMLEARLADIGENVSMFNNTAENTSARVDVATMRANMLISYADMVNNHVRQLYDRAQNATMEVSWLNNSLASVTATLQMQAAQAAAIESNITAVASQYIGRNFSNQLERARVVLHQAESVNSDAQSYLAMAQIQQNQAITLAATLGNISASTDLVAMAINVTQQALDEVEDSLQQASIICAQVASDVSIIEATVNSAFTSIDEVEETIKQFQGGLILAEDDIHALISLLGQEGGGSGLGVTLGIGSGLSSGVAPGVRDVQPSTVSEGVSVLRAAVDTLRERVDECAGDITSAEQHATTLEALAANISSILNASLDVQRPAVGAILNYTVAINTINQTLSLTSMTNTTIRVLLETVMVDELQSASSLLTTSDALLMMAQQANISVTRLLQDVSTARSQVMLAANRSDDVAQLAVSLAADVDQLRMAAGMTLQDVSRLLSSTTRQLEIVNSTHTNITLVAMDLLTNVTMSLTEVDNAQQMFNDADSALDSANLTALAALQATTQRSTILTNINQSASANAVQLAALNASIDTLTAQLQEAMQAAASIDVALRFYGNSSLGYRVPAQATDDSTTISLVFQPSDASSGVMLHTTSEGGGESLGLRLSNGSVQFEFDDGRLLSSPSGSVQQDHWYQLYATRERRMTLLSVSPLQGGSFYTTMGSSPLSPFVLSTSDTLYLGGIPNTLVVSDGYEGCLDRVVVNNARLSLSLPDERNETLTFCGPRPPAETQRTFETGVWLQGAGSFLSLSPPSSPLVLQSSELQVQVAFRTFSPDGLLLQMFGVVDMMQYLSLSLSGGRVVMEFASSSMQNTTLETSGEYSDGNWYLVTAELSESNVTLTVNMTETVFTDALNLVISFNFSNQIYVGGLSPDVQANIGSSPVSFAGCMDDLQVNEVTFDLQNNTASNRASFGGCPAVVAAGVRFMGEGMASFRSIAVAGELLSDVSFAFRSTQLAALLLNIDAQPAPLSVSLYHTWVRVDLGASSLLSSQSGLSDNQWHRVSVTLTAADNETNMTITVDNETVSTLLPSPPPTLTASSLLVVGGINDTSSVLVAERFRGCFDSLILNGRPVDFNDAVQLDGVSLYGCRPPDVTTPILPPPPPPLPPPPSIRPNVTIGLDGSSGSFLAYPITEAQVLNSFSILLEFQTVSSDTILLYTQRNWDFLALELRDGRLVYSYNLGSGRTNISSTDTYSDGLLHVVELHRTGRSGELVVDGGLEIASGSSPGNFTALNIHSTMLYVGGTPTTMPPTSLVGPRANYSVPPSALACFHALAINNRYIDLSMPQAMMGAEECRDTYTNIASFNGTGYIQLLDRYYPGIRFAFSMEVRTTQCDGLLAYVATPLYPDHVLLEIVNGTVRFLFDNGPRAVVVEYTPTTGSRVCDGQWHSLRAEKEALTGRLYVDGRQVASNSSEFRSFLAVNTNHPLFIGGVPDEVRARYTVQNGPFQGCLSNFYLTREDRQLEKVLFEQGSIISNVDLHTCLA